MKMCARLLELVRRLLLRRRVLTQMSTTPELSLPSGPGRRRAISAAARAVVMALATVLLAGEGAQASCAPQSANGVTATCTGTTTNQGGGAPGTSAGTDGYGLSVQTGVTVTINNGASVTGTLRGIDLGDATVTNNAGAHISGGSEGIATLAGFANVTNSGSIAGTTSGGVVAATNATVTNNIGATITGGTFGIFANAGFADITNSGSITGTSGYGIFAFTNATVTNNAGAIVTGGTSGIFANSGFADITNSGSIAGTSDNGIYAQTNAMVSNNTGAIITGGSSGIFANSGFADITNSGSIVGISNNGIYAQTDATVTNNAGASITGLNGGVAAITGSAVVTNSGSITGTSNYGIFAGVNATVTNNAGATVIGGQNGIAAFGFANVTNSGSITGGQYGIIVGSGGSSVFNAGTISGISAAIRFAGLGNTLTLAPGSVITGNVLGTGSDTFQLGGTGAATFDASQLGPTAQYRGFGTFNKIDSSVWTLTGTSTFAGDINVNAGTLVVNGNLASAAVMFVNPGGTLSGTGTVPFTLLDNGATLAPGPLGTGTGMLTIKDRVLFCTCSIYAVKVSGTGNDFAQVMAGGLGSGDAFLGGAVHVSSPTSSYRFNSPYTILTTQGGLNGTTFDSLATPSGISGSLSYTADNVLLTLTSQLGQIPGLNVNQHNVATALDTAFNGGGNSGTLGGIFLGNVTQNLTQASGEIATGSQQTTFDAMSLFMGLMTDPFTTGRGGATPGATGFADEDGANAYATTGRKRSGAERDAYGMIAKGAPRNPVFDPRWSVWTAGFGGSQTTDGNVALGSNNTASRVFGMAAGADYIFSPRTIAGFALAGGGTNFSVANGGSGRSDLFQAGAFVRHTVGSAYLTAAAAYGWQDITTDRTVTIAGIDQLRAQFNANAWSGRIEGGNRFALPWVGGVGLTPYAAGQFTTFDLPAYAEQAIVGANAFALAYMAKTVTATRSELGLRSDKSYAVGDAILTLRGRAAWAHDYNADRNVAATFQTLPGASFVVNGAASAHDAALTTASAEMKFISGLSLAATFEGEFSHVTRSYAGKGVARYVW
jgi:uncharacterized protein with beta-barrel porin domain